MKRKPVSTFGALHPELFFTLVYIVALFFSIFICSTLFYSCNSGAGGYPNTHSKNISVPEKKNTELAWRH